MATRQQPIISGFARLAALGSLFFVLVVTSVLVINQARTLHRRVMSSNVRLAQYRKLENLARSLADQSAGNNSVEEFRRGLDRLPESGFEPEDTQEPFNVPVVTNASGWHRVSIALSSAQTAELQRLNEVTSQFDQAFFQTLISVGLACGGMAILLGFTSVDLFRHRELERQNEIHAETTAQVLSRIREALITVNCDGLIGYLNPAAEQTFHQTSEQLIGRPISELPNGLGCELTSRTCTDSYATQTPELVEVRGIDDRWYSLNFYPDPEGVSVFCRDITSERHVKQLARERTELFDNAYDGVARVDLSGHFVEVNRRFAEQVECSVDDLLGQHWTTTVADDDIDQMKRAYEKMILDGRAEENCRTMRIPDGSFFWSYITLVAALDQDGRFEGYYFFTRDITLQKEYEAELENQILQTSEAQLMLELRQQDLEVANEQLEWMATMDGLTELLNHRAMQDRLDREVDKTQPLSILLLDVDKFKLFNDNFGHPAGDAVLKKVAAILRSEVRGEDVVARYGGEEFLVILPNTNHKQSLIVAERLRAGIENASWEHRQVTASFGASTLRKNMTKQTLIAQADEALYESKQTGRNKVTHIQALKKAKRAA